MPSSAMRVSESRAFAFSRSRQRDVGRGGPTGIEEVANVVGLRREGSRPEELVHDLTLHPRAPALVDAVVQTAARAVHEGELPVVTLAELVLVVRKPQRGLEGQVL
jgi:hypothetical protein